MRTICDQTLLLLSVLLFVLLLGACNRTSASSDYYKKYQSLDTPENQRLIAEALSSLRSRFGIEKTPVSRVHLRLSTPKNPGSTLARDFRLTEIVDERRGEFAIYLNRKPDEYAFVGQLAHQVFFLLNARLHDCYATGLSTYFAEMFVKEKDLDWSAWQSHLEQGEQPLYGASFFMIKELNQSLGGIGLRSLPEFAVWSDAGKSRMHIDIKSWLASLDSRQQSIAQGVIERHLPKIQGINKRRPEPLACVSP